MERGTEAGGAEAFAGRPLAEAELAALLERNFWGVLATTLEGRPYAVPVIYGWDGRSFYVLMEEGRKARTIEANPQVCLTVAERGEDGWRSAIIAARVEWVKGLPRRLRAVDIVRRQMVGRRAPSVRDAGRLARARIARLVPEVVTGRGWDGG
jgi:nitroimidazol reductase NimA-like FMN-containing flavoprotein (pyridoxamine 5'-phosphate oxidase superfamily)